MVLSLFIEDQFHQWVVVAPVPHHVVIARAQQAPLVLRIVGKVAAAFLDIENVRENRSQACERSLITRALGGRHHQVGIARAILLRESGPTRRSFLMQPGILRDLRHFQRRVGIVAQSLRVGIAPVRIEGAQLPVQQRLRSGGQSPHHRRGELHGRMAADLHHEIAHLHILLACRSTFARRRQRMPHRLQSGDWADLLLRRLWRLLQNLPDHRQILRAHLAFRRDCRQRRAWLAKRRPVLETPRGLEVIRVVCRLALIKADNPLDRVLLAIRLHQHRVRREVEPVRRQHHVIAHLARRLQVLVEQRGRHG